MIQRRGRQRGQGLVEFALGITIFLTMFIGLVDLARAAFLYNGMSDAARELARVTSVHPGDPTLGGSAETTARVTAERRLLPGLTVLSYDCIDLAGATVTGKCTPGNWVRVSIRTSFEPVLPLLAAFGTISFTTASSAKIQ
ncbi:MAG: pilus assembly protein [Chloroflexi bacterium]|nr:pilus assembly protein [Chloroflexota bacterium]